MTDPSRNILITGASSGIGQATALHLVRRGYTVYAGVRRDADAQRLQEIEPALHPVLLDVTKPADRDAVIRTLSANGRLHALVNNAGRNLLQPFEETTLEQADALMDVNFRGVHALTRACLPLLRADAGPGLTAKILNIGSIGSLVGIPWEVFYHASKFALAGWSEGLAVELYRDHIRVVLICPGGVKTPFIEKSRAQSLDSRSDRHAADMDHMQRLMAAVDRFGSEPEAVARKVRQAIASRNPRPVQLVGWDARTILSLKRMLPQRTFHALSRRAYLARPTPS